MYYLGIDGGGTKTRAVLTDGEGTILADRTAGPSNPNDITPEGSADVVAALVRGLLADAHISASPISLFAGIAGALNHRDTLCSAIAERLADIPLCGLDVRSDVQILLSAELPEGDGACIICGTGSACFLRLRGEIIRIGGWGYLLDSAGGYNIGRDAIEAALASFDGRGMTTTLTRRLADFYGAPVETLITNIYREGKPYIASSAPCVFAAAEEDRDMVAARILERNARALAEYMEAARRLAAKDDAPDAMPLPVVMGGGISQRQPAFVRLATSLVRPSASVTVTVASAPPVLGALLEAARPMAGREGAPTLAELHSRLSATLRA